MNEIITLALAFLLWFALVRWVLPLVGIETCMSGKCGVDRCPSCQEQPLAPADKDARKKP
jgi:hypothetical protein